MVSITITPYGCMLVYSGPYLSSMNFGSHWSTNVSLPYRPEIIQTCTFMAEVDSFENQSLSLCCYTLYLFCWPLSGKNGQGM